MTPLFDHDPPAPTREQLEEGAVLLRGFAFADAAALVDEANRVAEAAPFRHLVTPGGFTMSVAMTNCGRVGWVSDRTGYRYDPHDPRPTRPGLPYRSASAISRCAPPPRVASPITTPMTA